MAVNEPRVFLPPRQRGMFVHVGLIIVVAAAGVFFFWLAFQQAIGAYFILMLLLALAAVPILVLLVYRAVALARAQYILEREGLHLRWGLRQEDIPLDWIDWVRPAAQSGFQLPLPFAPLPGALIGTRQVEDLGPLEYMAAGPEHLLLVATPQRVYAISPANSNDFMRTFQRMIEMGSLAPIPLRSAQPAAFLQGVWNQKPARILSLTGLGLTLLLLVWTSLQIPGRSQISLGFTAAGLPNDPVPSSRLLLLPVLAALVLVTDWALGLFLYRYEQWRLPAYLIWLGSVLTPLLLLIATFFILF